MLILAHDFDRLSHVLYLVFDKEMSCGNDKSMNKGVRLKKQTNVMKGTHESHQKLRRM